MMGMSWRLLSPSNTTSSPSALLNRFGITKVQFEAHPFGESQASGLIGAWMKHLTCACARLLLGLADAHFPVRSRWTCNQTRELRGRPAVDFDTVAQNVAHSGHHHRQEEH